MGTERGLLSSGERAVADQRGTRGTRTPQGSKLFQFYAVFGKMLQNHMLAPHLGGLAPPPREILDPPCKGAGVRAERVVMALQSDVSWIMITLNPPTPANRQTDITENITLSQIR